MRRTPILLATLFGLFASTAAAGSLAGSSSAFVRAHANSPVRFEAWGEAAFARAKAEQKPLYVLVGAFTQELARAMREQSFAREENATMMNDAFVCVVVDRDEHSEVAAYLQTYVNQVKQMQGWPLSVWLTPELKPFEGASYLPPSDEWGKEGFPNALRRVISAWQTDPEAQRAKAEEALTALAAAVPTAPEPTDAAAATALLDEAAGAWLAGFDAANGGFGDPPRRLEPELLCFLLQRGDAAARDAATKTLAAVAHSPVRDPLDGGFFRSSADATWTLPTLQKSLSDQARTVAAYAEAAMRQPAAGAIAYVRSLGDPSRGYAAAEDGTGEAIIPSYLWTIGEARAAVGSADAAKVLEALGITEAGNLPPDAYLGVDSAGKNLPRWTAAAGEVQIDAALARMRDVRASRPAPPRDNAGTSGAHGLVLAAQVKLGDEPSMADAAKLAAFIRQELIRADGTLRSGPAFSTAAAVRDYALVADGLLAFAAASGDRSARDAAQSLIAKADALFWDAAAGRYLVSPGKPGMGVGVRVAPPTPDAGDLPSAESAMLLALCRHGLGSAARRAELAAAVAADIRDSATIARGDQLLALQTWLAAAK